KRKGKNLFPGRWWYHGGMDTEPFDVPDDSPAAVRARYNIEPAEYWTLNNEVTAAGRAVQAFMLDRALEGDTLSQMARALDVNTGRLLQILDKDDAHAAEIERRQTAASIVALDALRD